MHGPDDWDLATGRWLADPTAAVELDVDPALLRSDMLLTGHQAREEVLIAMARRGRGLRLGGTTLRGVETFGIRPTHPWMRQPI